MRLGGGDRRVGRGRNREGTTFRTFACDYGEPNGATTLVMQAFHAIARAHFGQTGATGLHASPCSPPSGWDRCRCSSRGSRRDDLEETADLNELAPLVLAAARDGDEAASAIWRGRRVTTTVEQSWAWCARSA